MKNRSKINKKHDIQEESRLTSIKEEHKSILSTWLSNGHNGSKAVREHRPDISANSAKVLFQAILKEPSNQAYIQEQRQEMRANIGLRVEQIALELMQWAYADPTTYVGLTADELKELPASERRALQSIEIVNEVVQDKNGNPIERESIKIRTKDGLGAMEKLIKIMGYYEADNRQKANGGNTLTSTLHKLPLDEQRDVLRAMQLIKKANNTNE